MKIVVAIACLLLAAPISAQNALYHIASTVTDVDGLRRLANSGMGRMCPDTASISDFCLGVFEPPGFYLLQVPIKSGIWSCETFLFQGSREHLSLRAYFPARDWVGYKAEWTGGRLIIRCRLTPGKYRNGAPADTAWGTAVELLP